MFRAHNVMQAWHCEVDWFQLIQPFYGEKKLSYLDYFNNRGVIINSFSHNSLSHPFSIKSNGLPKPIVILRLGRGSSRLSCRRCCRLWDNLKRLLGGLLEHHRKIRLTGLIFLHIIFFLTTFSFHLSYSQTKCCGRRREGRHIVPFWRHVRGDHVTLAADPLRIHWESKQVIRQNAHEPTNVNCVRSKCRQSWR